MPKKAAWGYVPSKGILGTLSRFIGHPHPNGRIRAKIIMQFIDKKKTIDLGCGEGIFCFELAKRGYNITGMDLSMSALVNARSNFEKLDIKINILNGSIDALPFKDGSFEQVLCLDVLEHVADPNRSLNVVRGILKKGGTLIITVPNELYLSKPILPYNYSGILKAIGHQHRGFDHDDLKSILENNGFKILTYRYYHKFFSRLTSEIVFALIGESKFRKARENMYNCGFAALLSFMVVHPINMLDRLLPAKTKGGFIGVKAVKV